MTLRTFENMTADFATMVESKPWKFGFDQVTIDTKNGYRMTLLVDETLEAVDKVYALAEIGLTFGFRQISNNEYVEEISKEDIEERLAIRREYKEAKKWAR